jgi:hypothetical protein
MAELNINEIKQDATDRLSLARKTEELQVLVDRMYPGFKVVLSKNGTAAPGEAPIRTRSRDWFTKMTQTEQIKEVLKDGPTELSKLFSILQERGSKVSKQSLMSLLSAGKRDKKLRKVARGIWALPEHVGTQVFEGDNQ